MQGKYVLCVCTPKAAPMGRTWGSMFAALSARITALASSALPAVNSGLLRAHASSNATRPFMSHSVRPGSRVSGMQGMQDLHTNNALPAVKRSELCVLASRAAPPT